MDALFIFEVPKATSRLLSFCHKCVKEDLVKNLADQSSHNDANSNICTDLSAQNRN